MNKYLFIVILAMSCLVIEAKKEEKTALAKSNTNLLEFVQIFKSLLNQALSKADFSSVRGMLSTPLSIGATAISVLLGGIVLMAFYESPLSPLPVPPLPAPPVGRFPPENPIVSPMRNGPPIQRLSMNSLNLPNQEQFMVREHVHRRQMYQPQQQYNYPKSQVNFPFPSNTNIKRSSNGDVLSYMNQITNNLKPSNFETPIHDTQPDSQSVPSSVKQNYSKNNQLSNSLPKEQNLLQSATSLSGHVAFADPNSNQANINTQSNLNPTTNNQVKNIKHNNHEMNDKVTSNSFAIKEQDFDQKNLVHSQLSQVNFKTSPELARLEENFKRSFVR